MPSGGVHSITQSGREPISTSIANGGKAGPCASLRPQLAFQFVEEAPIGVLGDDLLRRRLDQADFMEAQRIEAERFLGIVFPPSIVGNIVERLQRAVVVRGETRSTSRRAASAGWLAHRSAAFRIARIARLVATGWLRT